MGTQRLRRIVPVLLFIVLVGAAIIYLNNVTQMEAGALRASGTVEAVEVSVAPEAAGRVQAVLVDEGDTVQVGETLFQLEDDLLQGQRRRALAALATARAQLELAKAGATSEEIASAEGAVRAAEAALATSNAAQAQAEVNASSARTVEQTESSVAMAESNLAQANGVVEAARAELARAQAELARLKAGARPEEIAIYEAMVAQAEAQYLQPRTTHDDIVNQEIGGVPEELARFQMQAAESARNAAQAQLALARAGASAEEISVAEAAVRAAQAQVTIAEGGRAAAEAALAQAQASPETARDQVSVADAEISRAKSQVAFAEGQLAQAEAQLARLQVGATPEELAVLEAQIEQAQADLDLIDLQLDKLKIRAAVNGVIMTRNIEPGEIVQPGTVAMAIGQLDDLAITVYVSEDRYGQITLKESACVFVDSFPDECFEATVTRIADRAEFTPRNVQTEEGRRTTVFAVTLSLADPSGRLKPGMPADVDFELASGS
ncbi:MAG: efflux RND transporter periplasmic adaptor subunit [Chloroflexota bacterium]|jgi:HlyD family secretion protein